MPTSRSRARLRTGQVRSFLTAPRKIHATIAALTIYAVWMVSHAYSVAVHVTPKINTQTHLIWAVSTTFYAFAVCVLASKFLVLNVKRLWLVCYLGTIALVVSPVAIFWRFSLDESIGLTAILAIRLMLLISTAESIVGFLVSQISERAVALEQHQQALVDSEENFRKVIFSHLHDNVQSRLVSVGIQLEQLRSSMDADNSAKLHSISSEIEEIRASDVRDFGQSIVPQIEFEGLETSLNRLFESFDMAISASVNNIELLGEITKMNPNIGLGIYRIIEQLLLNSMLHGRAKHFTVSISEEHESLLLAFTNDGELLSDENPQSGHGFAVIDAWVTKFMGAWSLSNQSDGVQVLIRFPRPISHL